MKSTAKTLLFCVLCLFGIGVNAQNSGSCGENATWNYENGTLTISGTGAMTDYSKYHDSPWYSLAANLQEVIIEEGITTVGTYAFYQCTSLQTTSIPASVTSIGAYAFSETQLNSISIPASVISIGDGAFNYCGSLTSIIVAAENTVYDSRNSCNALIKTSKKELIRGCKNTVIPDGIESIGTKAFSGCTGLTSISIPVSVTSIGTYAFSSCTSLASVTFAAGINLTSIGNYAFNGCTALTSISLPGSLTSIGNYAFNGCTALTSITLPYSLTSIAYGTFNGCTTLETVTLPSNLTSIEDDAFQDCTSLTAITLPNGLTSIGGNSFQESGLTSVAIPASVTSVGNKAFYLCTSLTEVTFADGISLTSIGKYVFSMCSSLTAINLPGSLTSISEGLFDKCTNLASVTLPANLTSIGENAFQSSGLTSVSIPAFVTSIGNDAFYGCASLSTLSFADDSNLASVGNNVFDGCTSLTSVTLPVGLTSISYRLFYGCTSLASVTLPATLESIGVESFSNTGLTSVTIPASVTTIGTDAFSGCSSLADVYVKWADPFTLPSILSNSIFYHSNNANLTLHVPYGKTTVYQSNGWKYPDNEYGFANFVESSLVYVDNGGQQYESEFTGGPLAINDNFQKLISTKEVAGVDITYTRTFSSTSVWQAWYMPFDADYETVMSDKYEVAQILGVFMDAAGHTYITFQPMTSGTVKANTPYVVKPRTAGDVTITLTGASLKKTQGTPFTIQSSTQEFTFGGVYENTVNDTHGWYAINTEGNFQALDTDVYLRPMRIWMTIADRSDNPYATSPTPQQVSIRVLGDDTTGIGFIEETDAQQSIIYNLQGQQAGEGSKGIVIINGKKYLR